MTTVPSFTDLLKGARLPEDSHPVCMRADLVAQFETAERALEAERKKPKSDSLAAGGEVTRLVNRITELQQEMEAATWTFVLRALPKSKWRLLVAEHPPRRGEDGEPVPEDAQLGINREAFLDALLRVSVIDPLLTPEQWDELVEVLTDRQYADLCDAAWFLNRGEVSVPFSRAASLLSRDTANE